VNFIIQELGRQHPFCLAKVAKVATVKRSQWFFLNHSHNPGLYLIRDYDCEQDYDQDLK
jgi:hypothetical protein